MEIQFGPNPADEPNLLYKLQRKLKVFNSSHPLNNRGYNLVASSSKYGLVFLASPDGVFLVYQLKDITDSENENPLHLTVIVNESTTHISVSCDQELLAVTGGQSILIYSIASFQNQTVTPAASLKCDVNPATFVSSLQWNPCIPDTIALAFFDGTLMVAQVNNMQMKKIPAKARCLCWSPKGKQLVVGNNDGTLIQYKPDLSPMKTVLAPNLFENAPVEACAIHWIATYQFAVVYRKSNDDSRPAVTIVNTPKGGQPSCLNYEDICYSMGSNRPWYYYLHGVLPWNIILSASSNSMELATLGSSDGANWQQWTQTDEARPELPLTDKRQENYPVGLCIDTTALYNLPWGENESLPHMPLLLVLSQTGHLTVFNVINLNKAAPQLCTPPQQLALPGNLMTSDIPGAVQSQEPINVPNPQAAQEAKEPAKLPPAYGLQPAQQPPSIFSQQAPPQYQPQSVQPVSQAPQSFPFSSQSPMPSAVSLAMQPPPPPPALNAGVDSRQTPNVQNSLTQQTLQKPQPTPPSHPTAPTPVMTSSTPTAEANALKADQEKANMKKANEELKSMLVKEVNDFQAQLYKFNVKTRDFQKKVETELKGVTFTFDIQSLDSEKLKKNCSLEEIRCGIVQLKLELVRTCAAVADARTHAEVKDQPWSQVDPLTTKRLANIKKLTYYLKNQLNQAQRALDLRWNDIDEKELQSNKPGRRMIRPILDDVYQPLVKQQEILARHEAVLRKYRNTLNDCESTLNFRSTSLLRSTPFGKKDPLSKLTKNILNMSLEPQDKNKVDQQLSHKMDALREMLSNHKTVRIKPASMELSEHLAAMRSNYEKTCKERAASMRLQDDVTNKHQETAKQSLVSKPAFAMPTAVPKHKQETKPDLVSQQRDRQFSPMSTKVSPSPFNSVARTLFVDEPVQDSTTPKPTPIQPSAISKPVSFTTQPPDQVSQYTKNVLKDMLTNKQTAQNNDGNFFMGMKICSPTAFEAPPPSPKPLIGHQNDIPKPEPIISKPIPSKEIKPDISITAVKPIAKPLQFGTNLSSGDVGQKPASAFSFAKEPKAFSTPEPFKENQLPKVESKTIEFKEPKSFADIPRPSNVPAVAFTSVPSAVPLVQPLDKRQAKETVEKPAAIELKPKEVVDRSATLPQSPATSLFAAPVTKADADGKSTLYISQAESPVVKVEEKPKVSSPVTTPVPESSTTASSLFSAANKVTPSAESPSSTITTTVASTKESTPPVVTTSSIFGSSAFSSSPQSVFASAIKNTLSGSTDAPKETRPSIFGTPEIAKEAVTIASTTQSVFSSPATQSSIFGTPNLTQTSVFASPVTTQSTATVSTAQSSVFAATTTQSLFGSSTTPSALFSSANAATPQSVFGQANSVFGAPVTTAQSLFGTPPVSTQTSIFSSPTTAQSSIFGSPPTTTQSSVFGTPTTTQSSIFGTTTTTQSSIFGTTTTTQSSVFGTPITTQSPVFGTPTTTQSSIFGTPTTTQSSVFGTPTTTQSSVFGASPSSPQSIFGAANQSFAATTTQSSLFGSAPSTQSSIFGSPQTSTQSGSIFGGGEANLFASASISTTSVTTPSSGGSIFGGGSPGSIFGGGGTTSTTSGFNIFGSKSDSFGQPNAQTASIFGGGGGATTAATSPFGQKPATNLWGGSTNSGAFGGSAFGQPATTQAPSVFGTGSFSGPAQGSPFSSPQQQTGSAFGASPVFGNKPAFGQASGFGQSAFGQPSGFGGGFNKSPASGFGGSASFGSGANFGGGAAFGSTSPSKAFGGSSPGFGVPTTQSNSTFETLASQETLTFGNLAQQSGQAPKPAAPAFNTSPSFTGWRS